MFEIRSGDFNEESLNEDLDEEYLDETQIGYEKKYEKRSLAERRKRFNESHK